MIFDGLFILDFIYMINGSDLDQGSHKDKKKKKWSIALTVAFKTTRGNVQVRLGAWGSQDQESSGENLFAL